MTDTSLFTSLSWNFDDDTLAIDPDALVTRLNPEDVFVAFEMMNHIFF